MKKVSKTFLFANNAFAYEHLKLIKETKLLRK